MSDRHLPLHVLPTAPLNMSKTKLIFLNHLLFPLPPFWFQHFLHILPIGKAHLSLICAYFIHTIQRLLHLINSISFTPIVVCIVRGLLLIFNITQLVQQAPVTFSQESSDLPACPPCPCILILPTHSHQINYPKAKYSA